MPTDNRTADAPPGSAPCSGSATYEFKKNIKRLKDASGLLTRYKADGVTEYHRDLISEAMVNIEKVIKAEYDARKTCGRSKRTQTLGA